MSQAAEKHPMATKAANSRSLGRCAMLFEKMVSKLLDNWMRHQVARLRASLPTPAQELTTSSPRKERL
jgi:hypothetical protein